VMLATTRVFSEGGGGHMKESAFSEAPVFYGARLFGQTHFRWKIARRSERDFPLRKFRQDAKHSDVAPCLWTEHQTTTSDTRGLIVTPGGGGGGHGCPSSIRKAFLSSGRAKTRFSVTCQRPKCQAGFVNDAPAPDSVDIFKRSTHKKPRLSRHTLFLYFEMLLPYWGEEQIH